MNQKSYERAVSADLSKQEPGFVLEMNARLNQASSTQRAGIVDWYAKTFMKTRSGDDVRARLRKELAERKKK